MHGAGFARRPVSGLAIQMRFCPLHIQQPRLALARTRTRTCAGAWGYEGFFDNADATISGPRSLFFHKQTRRVNPPRVLSSGRYQLHFR